MIFFRPRGRACLRFSALQRAENSSIAFDAERLAALIRVSVLFSEPKIPQSYRKKRRRGVVTSFSALQRAENSSIAYRRSAELGTGKFQCSSASRKFLNYAAGGACGAPARVSVLFSEPKIPQSNSQVRVPSHTRCFSALQRAENSSILQC